MNIILKISEDFSITPGPRRTGEGAFSGEEFYNDHLKPKYLESLDKDVKLIIDLDGTYGIGFLEEVFGGLVRDGYKDVLTRLEFISTEEAYLIDDIKVYIIRAEEIY